MSTEANRKAVYIPVHTENGVYVATRKGPSLRLAAGLTIELDELWILKMHAKLLCVSDVVRKQCPIVFTTNGA